MQPDGSLQARKKLAAAILTDIHFWIPVVVLAAGLMVLHWIS